MNRTIPTGALAGLLWAAAFCFYPEWTLVRWFVGMAGLTLLLSLWAGERAANNPKAAAAGSFAFGLCAFAAGCYWIYHSVRIVNGGPVALAVALVVLLAALMGCWYALGGYWAARMQPKRPWTALLLVLPCVLVLTEWLRGWVFTGFPWLSAGYLTAPVFAGRLPTMLASLGGMYLVGLATVLLAGACLLVWRSAQSPVTRAAGLLLLLGGAAGLGQISLPAQDGESRGQLHARLVQGGIPQERKWLAEEFVPTLDRYEKLSFGQPMPGDSRGPALIVWPEVAVTRTQDSVRDYLDEMDRLMSTRRLALALGILTETDAGRFNSLIVLGNGQGTYHKHHLVPFGEFFPVPDGIRDWLLSMNLPASDLVPGPAGQAPLTAGEAVCGVSICYEAAFGSEQRRWAPAAEVLVNVSNDGWFGDTVALEQHLDMARVRAMETGRYLLRATGTGITAAIDPGGRIIDRLPKYEGGFLDVSVPRLAGATPYVRYGEWPVVVLCLLLGIALPAAVRIRNGGARPNGAGAAFTASEERK
ncbi:MAG: apolipoprotein N-acyltransferase [Gammaproteobacteria bacterium]|nr:apolipoprotein N-acyltransferase [Gammaproteobacteria bacterium]MDE0415210.1 apolipoprotein N-acyltransferase [Gammaproteobacteria bacterium]